MKPTRGFAEFDLNEARPVLVDWVGNAKWDFCKESLTRQFTAVDDILSKRVEDGLEFVGPADEAVLLGRWALQWEQRASSDLPKRSGKLWWVHLSRVIARKAILYEEKGAKPVDVVLASEEQPPRPFDESEAIFRQAFFTVLEYDRFQPLRDTNFGRNYYSSREKLLDQFWPEVKTRYAQIKGAGK